jgi:hypothetical protein
VNVAVLATTGKTIVVVEPTAVCAYAGAQASAPPIKDAAIAACRTADFF